jgi:23S rRNA (guanosine2251-2'-O)-methyltransferase
LKTPTQKIYGINPVIEALKSEKCSVKKILFSHSRNDRKINELITLAKRQGITCTCIDSRILKKQYPHKGVQGVVAEIVIPPFLSLRELSTIPAYAQEPPFFVILDSIEDPRNFGAIIRTAEAAGVHGIVFPSHRSAGIGEAVFKTSSGALEHLPLSQVVNIKHSIEFFKEQGITIIGLAGEAPQKIWSIDLTIPVALVLGSEDKGLKRTVKEQCDSVVSIPVKGKIDSLNVSVAAGIAIFEVIRQRV